MSIEQSPVQFIDWVDEDYIFKQHHLNIHQIHQLGILCKQNFQIVSLLDDLDIQVLIVPNKQLNKYIKMFKQNQHSNSPLILSFTTFLSCCPKRIQLIIFQTIGLSTQEQINGSKKLNSIYLGNFVAYHDLYIPFPKIYTKMLELGYQVNSKPSTHLNQLHIGKQFISLTDFLKLQAPFFTQGLYEIIDKNSQHTHKNHMFGQDESYTENTFFNQNVWTMM